MTTDDSVNQDQELSGGSAESKATPELNAALCSYCESYFAETYRVREEVKQLRGELRTSWQHGRALSEEVDRLRGMIKEANRMGFEILEQINTGSGAKEH